MSISLQKVNGEKGKIDFWQSSEHIKIILVHISPEHSVMIHWNCEKLILEAIVISKINNIVLELPRKMTDIL